MATARHWLEYPLARRAAFAQVARAAFGVSLVPALDQRLAAAAAEGSPGRAQHIIFLFMQGAMSHLDTFDPKPGREEQGETRPIQTKTPGVLFGHALEKLAGLSDRLAVFRSLSTETGAHEQGQYL
ncbi:MAG: DUF1501 domain-containing protein, partial [Planctomycetia bacterium]